MDLEMERTKQYEYKTLSCRSSISLEDELNKYARKGWRMCGCNYGNDKGLGGGVFPTFIAVIERRVV